MCAHIKPQNELRLGDALSHISNRVIKQTAQRALRLNPASYNSVFPPHAHWLEMKLSHWGNLSEISSCNSCYPTFALEPCFLPASASFVSPSPKHLAACEATWFREQKETAPLRFSTRVVEHAVGISSPFQSNPECRFAHEPIKSAANQSIVFALRLVVCGFNPEPGHTKDYEDHQMTPGAHRSFRGWWVKRENKFHIVQDYDDHWNFL